MKIYFDAEFHTDGDFSFDKERLSFLFDDIEKQKERYKNSLVKINYSYDDTSYEIIYISLYIEGLTVVCRWIMRDLIEALICSISTTKYYLVRNLYELLHHHHINLWNNENEERVSYLYGNYSFTEVRTKIDYQWR